MPPTSDETSLDKRRWLVMSICLHIVVIPPLRGVIAKKIETVYQFKKKSKHIDTQTYKERLRKISRNACKKLNYENINENELLKDKETDDYCYERFNYKVENAVSLANLLVTPAAKFTAFDESLDALTALTLLSYKGLFGLNINKYARDVKDKVRTECAHPNFSIWTKKYYMDCFRLLKDLVSQISKQFGDLIDKNQILHRLQWWQEHGTDFCLGSLDVPDFLRDSLQEVKAFSEAFTDLRGTLSEEVQRQISEALELFKSELGVNLESVSIRQFNLGESQNQERDGQDNISDRIRTLENNQEALKKENEDQKKEIEALRKTVCDLQTQVMILNKNCATFGEQEKILDSV